MSTSPYSIDFRKKVIEFVKAGNSQRRASKLFNISKSTISTWCIRYKKEGSYAAKKRHGANPRIKVDEFIKYVKSHPNATTSEIGKKFNMTHGGKGKILSAKKSGKYYERTNIMALSN